ncbi:MAG TPA: hypothetical protein VFL16_13570 [Steroidobacteraceae bacterium]|nr:hypothetical protein [Steroidobacteraceae bacterium]
MKRILASMLISGLMSSVHAGPDAEDIAQFVSSHTRWNDAAAYGESATLYLAVANTPTDATAENRMAAASASLAQQWRISEPTAQALIENMIEGTSRRFGADRGALVTRAKARFRELLQSQPDSPEAWALAVRFWDDESECGDTRFRDEYLARPFAAERFLQLDSCQDWMPAFARLNPGKPLARLVLTDWLADRDSAAALAAARWSVDGLPGTTAAPSDLQLFAVRRYWSLLGKSGLASILAGETERSKDLDALVHRVPDGELRVEGAQVVSAGDAADLVRATRRHWLLALTYAGRLDEARAEMRARPDEADDGYLRDAVAGYFHGDIYARYVDDGKSEPDGGESDGELWASYHDGVTGMRVAARFLAAHHMESGSALLRADACNPYEDHHGWPRIKSDLQGLPKEFQEYWSQYQALLAESRRAAGCADRPADELRAMSSHLPAWPEVPLDAAEKALTPQPDYPNEVPLPESFERVRAERQGDEIRVVCLSPAVDPGGEVSPGGYWLARSLDGGAHWQRPLYLGFQHQAPYVVHEDARISMFAPGALRLEVDVAEVDPESITFPPVALSLRREASDLRIDIPLAEIERDQDGDGLTDMLEAKIATDPANPDTDGDGLDDSLDDFPQASARGDPHPLAPIIVDVLKRITGYERAGIIEPVRRADKGNLGPLTGLRRADAGSMLFQIIEGDARMFNGLRANGQVIVLSPEQVAEISARSGPFYPLSFPTILVDPQRTRAFVSWSAGWTGGTITYRLRNGRWVGKAGAQWVTQEPRARATVSPG